MRCDKRNDAATPAHPNVVQAARHFGFLDPETRGAQAFRRWAHKVGAKAVLLGKRVAYDLKQLEELWAKHAS